MFCEEFSSLCRRRCLGRRTALESGTLLLGPACSGGQSTAAWAAAHCCGACRTAAWAAASVHSGADALLQFTMRPPSSLLLALQRALLRRTRSGHACSIVCGSFATQSDDGVLPHIRNRWGRRRTEAGCRWPSKDDRLPPAVGRRLSASGRRKRRRAADMLGISGGEFLVLLVVGALVLGPKNIAEALRAMRKGIEALRQWSAGMRAGADGELGVAEKEVAALANLDLRQLDPRRIVREAVRDEMEAWMAMAGAGGAGPSSSEKGADPAGDGANRAARTAERAVYSAAAFARAGSERAGSRRTSSKRAGPKGADAAATKGAHATQEPDACALHEPAACAPHKPAAQTAQGLDGQGPHKPAAQAAQGRAAQAEPEPNEKSPGELSAARDSIEGDKL